MSRERDVSDPVGSGSPLVSVVVVTIGRHDLVVDCLAGLAAQTYEAHEVVLVCNGAPAGVAERLARRHPHVRLVRLARKLGFAGGANAGIRASAGELVALINDDAVPEPDWLELLVAAAGDDPSAGVIACTVTDVDDTDAIDSQGLGLALDGMSRQLRPRQGAPARPLLASGCACLLRRSALQETGLFDERFFAYCEDADLSLRLLWAGSRTALAPGAVVRHHGSAALGSYDLRKVALVERNHFWVAAKGFPWPLLGLVPLVTLRRLALQVRLLLSEGSQLERFVEEAGRARLAGAVGRAWLDALAGLPHCLRERRRVLGTRRVSQAWMTRELLSRRLPLREVLELPAPVLARERASAGAWLPPWVRAQHEARYRFCAARLAGEDVIECACGDGSSSRALLAGSPASLRGFDLDEVAATRAREKVADARASFAVADARALPVEAGAAGVYVCLETLEHVEGDEAVIAEAHRVLRPGGLLLLSTPNRSVTNPGAGPEARPLNPYHVREYTRAELEALLEPHFERLEWYGQSPLSPARRRLLTLLGRRLSPAVAARAGQALKLPLLLRSPPAPHEVRPLSDDAAVEYLVVAARARA